ncbi:MAG: protease complex subunit PrcB family protein [Eisenbergiella massiliensis]
MRVGYGKQESGGYVTVNELYETDNAIYVNTNLLGPKAGSSPGTSPSYPYIVLKIEFRDKTVVFD